ncbi:MAG TPA: orotidine-5'-phosphate decarboxylase [Rhodospirillaceae bacterium]|nr:orotidine-5'-phosphate decarboxylase [Rhodospirillaceae bacterium]
MTANPVFCALDCTGAETALSLAGQLRSAVGGLKLGLEFFTANGPAGLRAVAAAGLPLFLDLKFHDIPNTVAGAIRGILPLAPAMTTLHASGGLEMMRAAVAAAAEAGPTRPLLLAVTVLTSLGEDELASLGVPGRIADQVKRLAGLAQQAGVDGLVCSPHEVAALRALCGPAMKLVVPGIRPAWAAANDQKRILTPAEAMAAGADILVIGRPITQATDPAAAARRIAQELGHAG